MRKGFLASVAALAAGAGVAFGQDRNGGTDPSTVAPAAAKVDPAVQQAKWNPLYAQGVDTQANAGALHQGCCDPDAYRGILGNIGHGNGGCGPQGCGAGGCGQGHGLFDSWKCGDGSMQIHKAAGGPDCFYFDLDLLYLYGKSMAVSAPVLTAGPIGSLGRPGVDQGVTVLFGDRNVDFGPQASLRLSMGAWDECRRWGIEAVAMLTEQKAEVDQFNGPVNGRTVLARPFLNALFDPPIADSIVVASPPDFGGSAGVYTNSRFGSVELNLMRNWAYYDKFKLKTLVGFRWGVLNEQLRIDTNTVVPLPDPSTFDITDSFSTRNNFYGGQIGFNAEFRHNRWFTDVTAKLAGGLMHEKLNAAGATSRTVGGVFTRVPFGAYVLEPNSGEFTEKEFAFMPEGSIKFGYQWTQRVSTFIGYDALYINRVIRPGEQVNPNLNPTLLPISAAFNPQFPFGPAQPAARFDTSDYWLQGVQFGVAIRY